jgi:pyruvate formate lyase activating enzyme
VEACPTGARTAVVPGGEKADKEGVNEQAEVVGDAVSSATMKSAEAKTREAEKKREKEQGTEKIKIVCDWSTCTNCGACAAVCPTGALYYCGVDHIVDDLVKRIKREKSFYDKSGGGVTTSGGECLCQPDGVAELFRQCKEIGVSTAADTCGLVPWKNIEKVLPYTDLFLYDIKHMDSERHAWATGAPNGLILENARRIAKAGGRFHIRFPLIPGFNDGTNVKVTRDFLLEIKDAIDLIQVLPFHTYGEAKYDRLSMEPPQYEYVAPTEEQVASVVEVFEDAGFKVTLH